MRTSKALIIALGLVLCSGSLQASTVPLCTAGTIADFIALGPNGCQIGDKLFYAFSYVGSGFGGATAIPADGVAVTPISTPLNPGLIFNAAWTAGPGQGLDSMINFSVQVLPGGAPITDISATMNGYGHIPDGLVAVAETTTINGTVFGNLLLSDSILGTKAYDELKVPATDGPITVHKDISVNGNTGLATVSGVRNQFSESVPEPASMTLLGCGLALCARYLRRKQ